MCINTEFKTWKEEYEKINSCWFIRESGKKGRQYYYCNRSGYFTSKSTGKRHLKSQGTSKINARCTAGITVKFEGNKCLRVVVNKTHYGHKTSLGHLRIAEQDRLAIAGKLSQGVDIQHILDNIRDKLGTSYTRIHLLTRKDVTNIEKTYCLKGIQRHQDDATSIHMWVEEMNNQENSPVLLYKPQGQSKGYTNLSPNDFILAIQTPLQADIMKRFSDGRVICVDGTHGTNGYDFTLITVMIIDEYGEGFPVAWCISNKEDQAVLLHFYQAIKEKVGLLTPRWFMSDLAEQFYSAWVSVFNTNQPKRLFCAWHVDRAWRENLKQFSDNQVKVTIYHNLRVLLEETDINKFETLLEKTLLNLESSTSTASFANYFRTYYGKRKEQWAGCYRKGSLINTNMYVEAFHRVLKYVYLKGKVNKRLDKCVGVLLKLARDKGFDRLVKLEKGKNTERITMIRTRHLASLKMPLTLVRETEEYQTWEISSVTQGVLYHVSKLTSHCPYSCSISCADCKICIHMFQCNCPDSLIRGTICKHIHLIKRYAGTSTSRPQISEMDQDNAHNYDMRDETIERLKDATIQTNLVDVENKLATLAGCLSTIDMDTLGEVKKLITSALNLVKAREHRLVAMLPAAKYHPPNQNIKAQRPFFSTKRKRSRATVRMGKPTNEEKLDICKALLNEAQPISPLKQSTFSEFTTL